MSPLPADPYKALGIDRYADISTIKTAYRKLVLRCHPDKVQDPALKAAKQDEFQRVQQAYEILSDEKKRSEYDEDANLRKLRDELSRGMGRTAASPRSAPNAYEPNIHNAEPRASFKPGPPPMSPFTHYSNEAPKFSHTTEFAFRTKVFTDSARRSARRATSSEKTREDVKEDRRRRKDDDDYYDMARERERERDRERDREMERERQRERDRKPRADRERDDKKERSRRDNEKRDKDRDRARRQDQQEKSRSKKSAYVEDYSELDGGLHPPTYGPKKKTSGGIATPAGANTSSRRHSDSARGDRSGLGEESPRPAEIEDRMRAALDYIGKKKTPHASTMPESILFSRSSPDDHWHPSGGSPRPRRSSQDDKKTRSSRNDIEDLAGEAPRDFIPPRLSRSYTSPTAGTQHMPASAPRVPNLTRAATEMAYSHPLPEVPAVPVAPVADSSRHSRKSDRRRRDYYDAYDDDIPPARHMSSQPRVFDTSSPPARGSKTPHYRPDYYSPTSGGGSGSTYFSDKVKMSPRFSRDQVHETKPISEEDVRYASVHRSCMPA